MDYIRLKYIKIKDNRNGKTLVYSEKDSDFKAIGMSDNGNIVLFKNNNLAKIIYRPEDDNLISDIKWDNTIFNGPDLKTLRKKRSKNEPIGGSLEDASSLSYLEDIQQIGCIIPTKTFQEVMKETSERMTKTLQEDKDEIDHPSHYTKGKVECIEYIIDQDMNYIVGNILKYLTRYKYKDEPIQDLKKALKYLEFDDKYLFSQQKKVNGKYTIDEYLADKNIPHYIDIAITILTKYNQAPCLDFATDLKKYIKLEIDRLEGKDE